MQRINFILGVLFLLGGLFLAAFAVHWNINRVYVPEGHSLLLTYKGPLLLGSAPMAKPGHFADPEQGEKGVLREMPGPGRHFYCPIWWKAEIVPDVVVKPGEVAIVTSKLGDPLPAGEFLVDGELGFTQFKGMLRKVFGPGRYRINPYGYEHRIVGTQAEQAAGGAIKYSGWVAIPAGYVGVVTNQDDNPATGAVKGVQSNVLPPGIYPINPREQVVDIVPVGFWETGIDVERQIDRAGHPVIDESGEPLPIAETGIAFPSNDGFPIQLDFTAIWGIMPEQAPEIIRTFGSVEAAEQKVIIPQSESICRNSGSRLGAVELLVGESRQAFQTGVSTSFRDVLDEKHITLLYGLVRHIYIPREVRVPIQNGYIADELKLTREEERNTAKIEANLREAERRVELETEKVRVETEKEVANVLAEGEKEAKEIEAETKQLVAEIDRKIAELDAQRTVLLGEATAGAELLKQEAQAGRFQLAVEAFGDANAYNKWQFAEGLPSTIDLKLFYAGEGTLWTDLKGIMPTISLPTGGSPAAAAPPARPAVQPARPAAQPNGRN